MTTLPSVVISRELNSINIFNTLVLAHEIAHCIGLLHTHETSTCTENINRSGNGANCSTCGDQLCDTHADPGLAISTSNVNDNTCVYIGGATQNGIAYTPNTRNIMSYSLPNCLLSFTLEQGNRMKNFIQNTNILDNQVIPFNRTLSGSIPSINFPTDPYIGVQGTINITTSITAQKTKLEAGNSIIMNSGFLVTSNAVFEANINSYSCITPLVVNSAKTDENSTITQKNPSQFNYDLKFTLYPNPSVGRCNIEFEIPEEKVVSITISDFTGREIKSIDKSFHNKGITVLQFDTDEFATGTYLVNFSDGEHTSVKHLEILH